MKTDRSLYPIRKLVFYNVCKIGKVSEAKSGGDLEQVHQLLLRDGSAKTEG